MIFTETEIPGAFLIELERIQDERGFFARAWCRKEFQAHGLHPNFVQVNLAFNNKIGTLRGMHFQAAPHEEVKLVRCTRGAIFDVIIDLRPHSSTYKRIPLWGKNWLASIWRMVSSTNRPWRREKGKAAPAGISDN